MIHLIKEIVNNSNFLNNLISKRIKSFVLFFKLKNFLKENDNLIFCFDLKLSPPTLGDFLYFLILIKFCEVHGKKITLLIINDEYRESWSYLNYEEKVSLINDYKKIFFSIFKKSKTANFSILKFKDLDKYDSTKIFLFNKVINRVPFYQHSFNILNLLLFFKDNKFKNKVLFNRNDFDDIKIKKPDFKYITLHLRYSKKWDLHRNITNDEFKKIYDYLNKKFPNHKIIVISDHIGCSYFRKLSSFYNFIVYFSNEYSDGFLGSAKLVLNSDFYFQYKGGGMSVIATFSKLSYVIYLNFGQKTNELLWLNRRLTSFANMNQNVRKTKYFNIDLSKL